MDRGVNWMKMRCVMKRTNVFLVLLMVAICSQSSCWASTGHIRGPHHPRASPRISVESSNHPHHHHYVPRRPVPGAVGGEPAPPAPILTHDKQLLHDKEHMKDDLGDWVFEDGKEMTPEEMEFHYFKMHDFDNNSKLDGLEILQAISHILPMTDVENDMIDLTGVKSMIKDSLSSSGTMTADAQMHYQKAAEKIRQRDEDFNYYIDLIDKVLDEDDMDKDGYLSYFEYVVGRRRDEETANLVAKTSN